MRSVEFHPEAEAELASAAQYFENHVEHLGMDFIVAVRGAYDGSSSSQTVVARSAVDSGGPSFAGSLRQFDAHDIEALFSGPRDPSHGCIGASVGG